ncbi:MAG: response regulator transcription factor, partial [Pseudomonadota bacterium]
MSRILLVDDDVELCEMLGDYLGAEGYVVDAVHDGNSALQQAAAGQYDLMVLDVMLPELNGFDVLRQLRANSRLPVLMLTARGDDVDSIVGLELGADDYLAKPCNPRVLEARIRAVLRRASESGAGVNAGETLRHADLEMHTGTRTVTRGGVAVELTSTEYGVLEVLLHDAGHVVSKADLSERALGRTLGRYDRSLDMHVSSLRRKLGRLRDGEERIKTVRGVGYQYV